MSSFQRVRYVFQGLMMLLCVAVLLLTPEKGYRVIGYILSVVLAVGGLRALLYYFTMARHMVGGKIILFRGIIALDLGMFAAALADIPPIYVLLYLLIVNLFSGAVDVMHAREARKLGAPWRLLLASGLADILMAVACAFCLRSPTILSYVYSAGLLSSACLRFAQAFRKTAIVYIS